MKMYIFYALTLGLFILGCKPAHAPEQSAEPGMDSVPEWVSYSGSKSQKIVLVSGDEEYRSEEALPQLGKILSKHHGFNCTVLFAQDPEHKGIVDPNHVENIPGLEHLDGADLMILFTRFRDLPDEQMQHFQSYLMAGKPLIAIRTATHAFHVRDSTSKWVHWGNFYENEGSPWHHGFGRMVLGERWYSHHGHHKHQSTRGIIDSGAKNHPVVNGISDGEIWGPTDVYGVRLPLPDDSKPIILGQVINREGEFDETDLFYGMKPSDSEIAEVNPRSKNKYNPNDPMMPIAWTKGYQLPDGVAGTSFTTTIGASTDLLNDGVRRLLVNATYFLLDLEVPEKAEVSLVGVYTPTPYNFHEDAYWEQKSLKISEFIE